MERYLSAIFLGVAVLLVAAAPTVDQAANVRRTAPTLDRAQGCQVSGTVMRLAGLPEASGLALSQATPGTLWSHNDSGAPEIFSIDAKGNVTARVAVSGATVDDWEAIAPGKCGSGSCLFIADIGDNDARRREVTIYRIVEPAAGASSATVDAVLKAAYPDGAHDAEALLAAPDGALYIVTKGDTGHVALYRVPPDARAGTTARLERVGSPISAKPADGARITDGAISPDGAQVVLRTRESLTFYRAADFLKGVFREVRRTDLRPLAEPQGEAVAFGPAGTVYVAGEGGGKSQPGTLAILNCPK